MSRVVRHHLPSYSQLRARGIDEFSLCAAASKVARLGTSVSLTQEAGSPGSTEARLGGSESEFMPVFLVGSMLASLSAFVMRGWVTVVSLSQDTLAKWICLL